MDWKLLPLTQQYLLCALDERGRLPGAERQAGLLAAGLLELQEAGCLSLEEGKARVLTALPADRVYLEPLYAVVDREQPLKLEKVWETYCFAVTDRRMRTLVDAVGSALVSCGLAETGRSGLLGIRKTYIPQPESVCAAVSVLRPLLLEDGAVSEKTAALAVLLDRGGCLRAHFSGGERRALRSRLKALDTMPEGKLAGDMAKYVESVTAAMAALAVAAC